MIAPLAAERGLALRHDIAEGTPEALVGDLARTRQVLVNLLGNAVKFTPQGEVRVALSALPLGDGRFEAHFAVTDTGIGIPGEELDRLFVPFEQLDGSLARQQGGTGLGLAISKRLTELMGGRIWVESAVGRGSTFHFTILGEAALAPPRSPTVPIAIDHLAHSHPLRILLAEDHPVNRQVTVGLLEHLGYEADLASNGREVLEVLECQSYDVVLMDVQMPEMDGLEVTRRIRGQFAGRGQPKIIALTAHAMPGDRERCLAAGMDGYLSKPLQVADLKATLAAISLRGAREGWKEEEPEILPAPLDPTSLDLLRGLRNGEGLVEKLIRTFLATAATDLAAIRQGVEEGRWSEVGRTVHRLQGSSAVLGVLQVASVCRSIEERVRAARTDELVPLVARLGRELARARAVLEKVASDSVVSQP